MASSLFSFLLSMVHFLSPSYSDEYCQWPVKVNNFTMTLNLERLQHLNSPIECALDASSSSSANPFQFNADWVLLYTPCRNGVNCSIPDNNILNATMVSQISNISYSMPSASCAAYLGVWDMGKTAPISDINANGKEQYVFEYKNGYKSSKESENCTNGRWLNVTYLCNEDIELISQQNVSCRQLPSQINGTCLYEMVIPTKLACLSKDPDDSGESEGVRAVVWLSVLIALLFVCYCVVGYVMNAMRYHYWTDYMANIPNSNIWCCCCYKRREYITFLQHGRDYLSAKEKKALVINDNDDF